MVGLLFFDRPLAHLPWIHIAKAAQNQSGLTFCLTLSHLVKQIVVSILGLMLLGEEHFQIKKKSFQVMRGLFQSDLSKIQKMFHLFELFFEFLLHLTEKANNDQDQGEL